MQRRQSSTKPTVQDAERTVLPNPNQAWIHDRGFPIWYVLVGAVVHVVFLSTPFLTTAWAWTLTNVAHTVVTFFLFHWLKGSPIDSLDEGESALKTQWEQIMPEESDDEYSFCRKFLIVAPVVYFFLTVHYTQHDPLHFTINLVASLLVMVAKHPSFENVRLFGVNKY